MPKMTLKEAQEVLGVWKTQEIENPTLLVESINNLLEAARVVEREKCIEALNSVGIVDQIGSSEHAFDAWVQAKTQCIEALKILSDNQDNNEGN